MCLDAEKIKIWHCNTALILDEFVMQFIIILAAAAAAAAAATSATQLALLEVKVSSTSN